MSTFILKCAGFKLLHLFALLKTKTKLIAMHLKKMSVTL
jgi:hypothetical protein